MDTYELRYALLCLVPKMRIGVCASDQLVLVKDEEFAIIVNTQDSTQSGLHWVCFFKTRRMKHIEFFDSIGIDVNKYGIHFQKFVNNYSSVKQSIIQFQSNQSDFCGMYCLWFLVKRSQGISYKTIISNMSVNDKIKNDVNIERFCKSVKFPNFSDCSDCVGCNDVNLSSFCVQRNEICYNITQKILK